MASTTAAGTGIAISASSPAAQTAGAYGNLSYTEIGNVESIGAFGAATEVVSFQPLKGPLQKYKGPTNYGSLTPTLAVDEADAGQALLAAAAAPGNSSLYAVRVTKPDGALRYFQVRVFGMPETIGAANSMITAAPVLEINTPIVRVGAGLPPAPVFSVQPSISPSSGAVGTTFTASDGAASNATSYTRRWLLSGTAIGTGTTVTPNAAGTLVLEVTATGPGGSSAPANSSSVTVSAAAGPTLAALTLDDSSFQRGVAKTVNIVGATSGSTLSGSSLPTGFSVNSAARTLAFTGAGSGATSVNLSIVETLAGATNSPRTSTPAITIAAAAVTLAALSLDDTSFQRGVPKTVNITGATAGSTITGNSLPSVFTLNSAARTVSWSGGGSGATNVTLSFDETLSGATNSPRTSSVPVTIAAAAPVQNLGDLTASDTNYRRMETKTVPVSGQTAGSSISLTTLPQFTFDDALDLIFYDGGGTGALTTTATLTETLAGYANSPKANNIPIVLAAAAALPAAYQRPAVRVPPTSSGTTRYVSNAGSDSNDGTTTSTPWLTIAKAAAWFATAPAGAQLRFRRGDTFTNDGSLYLYQNANGTSTNPLRVGAYGTGSVKPIIRYNGSAGGKQFLIQETSYVVVENIDWDCANLASYGLFVYQTGARVAREAGIYLIGNTVRNSAYDGIDVGNDGSGSSQTAGFDGVTISGNEVYSCANKGIATYSPGGGSNGAPTHTALICENNKVYSNGHDGIEIGGFSSGWANWNEVYENGATDTTGPVGMWFYNSSNLTMAFNEAHHNRSANTTDGDGLDIDGGCVGCVCENNFTHHNDGAGILHWAYSGGPASNNIIRNNVSLDDGAKTSFYGGITFGRSGSSTISGALIYNNTIIQTQASRHALVAVGTGMTGFKIFNNLLVATGASGKPISITGTVTGLVLDKNDFWSPGGTYTWGANTYSTFAAWQAISAAATSLNVDPGYLSKMANVVTLGGYDALALRQLFGIMANNPALRGVGVTPSTYSAALNTYDAFGLTQASPPQIGAGIF